MTELKISEPQGDQPAQPKGFFQLRTLEEAREICRRAFGDIRTGGETVPAAEALGRVLAADVVSPGPVPHFARSLVDGYALRSADTAGATAGLPTYLEVVGRVRMGEPTDLELRPGECAEVPTGGMLPRGADAAAMIEHTERLGPTTIEIGRALPQGRNIITAGEDVAAGSVCLERGRRLRPGELALLATIGVVEVSVFRRPRVALVSTGDEVVPPEATPGPAQVRDANAPGLAAMIRALGAEPLQQGIVADVRGSLEGAVRQALGGADTVLVSGGSSVGDRDHTVAVMDGLGPPGVLLHGVAIKPGKPTIVAQAADGRPLFGLPGHPLSAMVSFHRLVRPVLRALEGEDPGALWEPVTRARLTRKVPSEAGRLEYVRVRLRPGGSGELTAEPLFGKSAGLSSLIAAQGLVEVPVGVEGYDAGAEVEVILF